MSHNLVFIACLTVLPVLVLLCVLITCARAVAVNTNVEPQQPPSAPSAQQPMVAKRRSRTQDTLRSEHELSKYQKPIIKLNDGEDKIID